MTGAMTIPAPNHAINEAAKSASVTGNNNTHQPPAAMNPAPGSHNPSPNACAPGEPPKKIGKSPVRQNAA